MTGRLVAAAGGLLSLFPLAWEASLRDIQRRFQATGDYLGDPVITAAIVDRMVHHSVIVNIQGPSRRMNESKKLNATRKPRSTTKS